MPSGSSSVPLLRLLPMLVVTVLAACGGGDGSPVTPDPDNPDPPGDPVEAAAPLVSKAEVSALEPVVLDGLPADRTDLVAEVSAVGSSPVVYAGGFLLPLVPLGGTEYELRIPVHPTALAEGGEMDVRVRGDSLVTAPARVTLRRLPEAPGAFVAALDSLQLLLDLRLSEAGTTREAVLTADWGSELGPLLLPLAMAQTVLDDPAHGRDLRDYLAGSGDFPALLDAGSFDGGVELADRLVAAGGLPQRVAASLAQARGETPPPSGRASSVPGPDRVAPREITTAAELDAAMEEAWAAKKEIDPNTATGELLQAYGLTLGALGVFGGPYGEAVAVTAGSLVFAYSTYLEGTSKLLPTEFVPESLSFDVDIAEFEEDRPGPGRWSNVRVSALSEGWKVDKALLGTALQVLGTASAVNGWVNAAGSGAAKFVTDLGGFFTSILSSRLPEGNGDVLEIPPQTWTDIDISDGQWNAARVAGTSIVLSSPATYDPVEAGTSLLTVETEVTRFGDAAPILDRAEIRVDAIEMLLRVQSLDWLPESRLASPNEDVFLELFVRNALDTSVSWTLSDGVWVSEPAEVDDGRWEATLRTPADRAGFPVVVTATSTATGGARSTPGAPVRRRTLRLLSVEVIVDPARVFMDPGESQQFGAAVLGADDPSVTWKAFGPDGGEVPMGSGGLFTAPQSLGDYLVEATSVEDPAAKGYANVTVVGTCYWTLEIQGEGGGRWSGSSAGHAYSDQPFPGAPFTMTFAVSDTSQSSLLGTVQTTGLTASSPPGTWVDQTLFSFSPVTGVVWAASENPADGISIRFQMTENDGTRVTGSVTGTAVRAADGATEPTWGDFTLRFRSLNTLGAGLSCGGDA